MKKITTKAAALAMALVMLLSIAVPMTAFAKSAETGTTGETTQQHEHDFSAWKITKQPTCKEDGVMTRTCKSCKATETQKIPKLATHTPVKVEAVAPTCTKAGLTAGVKCSGCGKVYVEQKEIKKLEHIPVTIKEVPATCAKVGSTAGKRCAMCKKVLEAPKTIAKKAHTYNKDVFVKANAESGKDGSVTKVCTECKYEKVIITPAPVKVELEKKKFTYTGQDITPSVTVKDSRGKTISAKNYKVEYKNNNGVGKATVIVTFKGDKYEGTLKATFKIVLKGTTISKVTARSKGFKVNWNKLANNVTGYEIQYSTTKKFSKKTTKTLKITNKNITSATLSKLKANKKYYVRIRTLNTAGKETFKSGWSKVKTVRTGK